MKTILITGGAIRIGKGLALAFAEKQFNVAIFYNLSQKQAETTFAQIKTFGVESVAVKVDLRNLKEIEDGFQTVLDKFNNIDVLINNAGVFPKPTKLSEISEEMWDNTFDINLKAVFRTSKIFSKFACCGSRIINISSLGGLEIWKQRIPYNVSKSGLIQLTKALARELAPAISVNCICPGAIKIPDEATENEEHLVAVNKIPMERYGTVQDIFDVAYFFAECSNYITGQIITLDGGYHLYK